MSAPSFMAESSVLTQQEEGLQEDIKEFQKKVKERFACMNSATIESLTLQLQKAFISNLKELAKICFLTFLPVDSNMKVKDINLYAQAALARTLKGITDTSTLTALNLTNAGLRALTTSILSTANREDFETYTTISKLLDPPEENDPDIGAKTFIEVTATILIYIAPFLITTPLKNRETTIATAKIDNVKSLPLRDK
mmetsp:Transcript_11552/g.16478  ORF Transcript_11552/g.16478 Transcript_11552/m.16478 type:complete len:197 (-) Transcript_11552:515-1105(-)